MIRNKKKTSKFMSALSAVIAVVMLGTTVFASGVLSNLATDDYTVEITNNGEKIELSNKPFIENGEVYVPLRETLEKIGIMDNANNQIIWDNGKIDIHIQSTLKNENGEYVIINHQIEIGKDTLNLVALNGSTRGNFHISGGTPILKQSVTYIPLMLVDNMANGFVGGINEPNNTFKLDYQIYDKDGKLIYPYSYHQVLGEYSIKIPDSWSGKYTAQSSGNIISFAHKATFEKYGSGTLFRIEKVSSDMAEEILNMLGGSRLLYKNDEYAYIFEIPTDVQYPIWNDRDEEDIEIAAEYERMFNDVDFIADSFDVQEPTEKISYELEPNAENLSFDDMTALQNDADNGHYPWRLDPAQTIREYAHSNNMGNGEITELAGTGRLVNALYTTGGDTYQVELFKPIRQDETGVWVVRLFEKLLN